MANDQQIAITDEIARRLQEKIDAGPFASPADVIAAALDALDVQTDNEADDIAWMKARVEASIADLGPGYSNEQIFAAIRERLKAKSPAGFHEPPARPLE